MNSSTNLSEWKTFESQVMSIDTVPFLERTWKQLCGKPIECILFHWKSQLRGYCRRKPDKTFHRWLCLSGCKVSLRWMCAGSGALAQRRVFSDLEVQRTDSKTWTLNSSSENPDADSRFSAPCSPTSLWADSVPETPTEGTFLVWSSWNHTCFGTERAL